MKEKSSPELRRSLSRPELVAPYGCQRLWVENDFHGLLWPIWCPGVLLAILGSGGPTWPWGLMDLPLGPFCPHWIYAKKGFKVPTGCGLWPMGHRGRSRPKWAIDHLIKGGGPKALEMARWAGGPWKTELPTQAQNKDISLGVGKVENWPSSIWPEAISGQ
ncbi:hypothetical protein O181_028287 [Austropuccinia psidii MF-1]|uniref:Uncharacterized protein n=1 Tax=Austropuccinia psidii MF-1 TaxID=1389203 RepID=A0A9Q3CRK9_9BASI|nr:hypothetical protein [Austropuccinia psidii MF-1]